MILIFLYAMKYIKYIKLFEVRTFCHFKMHDNTKFYTHDFS